MKKKIINIYPEWKKILWRFARVFIATFLVQFGTGIADSKQAVTAIAISALSAGVVAVAKAVRSMVKDSNPEMYEKVVKKLLV